MNPYFDNNMNRKRKSDPKKNAAGMLVSCIFIGCGLLVKHAGELMRFVTRLLKFDGDAGKTLSFDQVRRTFVYGGFNIAWLVWIVVALAVLIGVICILRKVFGGESHDTFGSARQERTIHHNLDLAKKTGKINLNGRLYTKEELKQLHL